MYRIPIQVLTVLLTVFRTLHKSKNDLILENISFRHQLSVYKSKKAKPKLSDVDWQKRRFNKHWTKISTKNKKLGRKRIKKEIRDLIYRMAGENNWGAPRIYTESPRGGF